MSVKSCLHSGIVAPVFGGLAAGREVRSLGPGDMGVVIVAVFRAENGIVPNGSTQLGVNDSLLVAATDQSMQTFRALVEPPENPENPDADARSPAREIPI